MHVPEFVEALFPCSTLCGQLVLLQHIRPLPWDHPESVTRLPTTARVLAALQLVVEVAVPHS